MSESTSPYRSNTPRQNIGYFICIQKIRCFGFLQVTQTRVTDHSRTWNLSVLSGYVPNILSPPGASRRLARTSHFVPTSANSGSHICGQLSGLWQFMRVPGAGHHNPFSMRPPCTPNIMEPGSGERSPRRRRATSVCLSNGNRWKKAPRKMAEMCPCSSLSFVTDASAGDGEGRGLGEVGRRGAGARKAGSKMFPSMKRAGKVAGVERKSSCPRSHSSERRAQNSIDT